MTELSWQAYCDRGLERAGELGNRGPMRFDDDGRLQQYILDAYRQHGFYVFTNVLRPEEITELTREFDALLQNAPTHRGADQDSSGRPVKFPGYYSLSVDEVFKGRDIEQTDEQESVVGLVAHPLMLMDSALRAYGHPDILRMVASVNGDDFVPFHESIFHKGAGEGPPTPWHQDGRTHWDGSGNALEGLDGSGKTHGFNLSVSWSHCNAENCLWVVPGSHRHWRLANEGEFPSVNQRLEDAVPMTLAPGDCGLVNRSSLHGAYPNQSDTRRITMVLGFHKRASAIGTKTTNVHAFKLPGKQKQVYYTQEWVEKRSRMIPLAIDARRQHFPDEVPYHYTGAYLGGGEWNEQARAEISQPGSEYWHRDITL